MTIKITSSIHRDCCTVHDDHLRNILTCLVFFFSTWNENAIFVSKYVACFAYHLRSYILIFAIEQFNFCWFFVCLFVSNDSHAVSSVKKLRRQGRSFEKKCRCSIRLIHLSRSLIQRQYMNNNKLAIFQTFTCSQREQEKKQLKQLEIRRI